ncbi:hypothetical protein EDB19DRAFT_1909329 [Suillus lakei]|nr:hypothetical protein EDB19DRAFT_1909329 [Suillus lakei]
MVNTLDTSTVPCPLYISGVTIDLSKLNKNVEFAEVRIGKSPTPIEHGAGKALRRTFSPPMELSHGDTFSLHLRYERWYGTEHEDIVFEPEDMFGVCDASERQEYNKTHKNISIAVELSGNLTTEAEQLVSSSDKTLELQPATDEISRICPRFRILVIGKTGVGKSSLINHTSGVKDAIPSHNTPGVASIDRELISPQNMIFVLHDSKGFEPGEEDNLKIVRDFIDHRREMPDLKDQLHAVWWGLHLNAFGGRLLETGMEAFLTSMREGKLGNSQSSHRQRFSLNTTRSSGRMENAAKKSAQDRLQDICIAPLEKFAGLDIPHATVSTNGNHEETLARLIQITEEHIGEHVGAEASLMAVHRPASGFWTQNTGINRVSLICFIFISRFTQRQEYWKTLATSAVFKNCSIWDCLHVLHIDIVNVWNFRDPHGYLSSPEFRKLMVKMFDEPGVGSTADPNQNIAFGLSVVRNVAGIVSVLAAPADPIILLIVASIVIAKWVYETYQLSRTVLQRFMKYIIDLTLVLQTLYLVSDSQELSRRAIKLAVKSYYDSPTSREVHYRIQEYDRQSTFLERRDCESLDQFVQLLQSYNIGAEEMLDLRGKLPTVDLSSDESW